MPIGIRLAIPSRQKFAPEMKQVENHALNPAFTLETVCHRTTNSLLVTPKTGFPEITGKCLPAWARPASQQCATREDQMPPSAWAARPPGSRYLPDAILFQSHEQQDAYRVVPRLEPTLFLTDECLPRTDARPFVGHLQPRSLVPDLRRADPTGQSAG